MHLSKMSEFTQNTEVSNLIAKMTLQDNQLSFQGNTSNTRPSTARRNGSFYQDFMRLPRELRWLIYEEIVSAPRTIDILKSHTVVKSRQGVSETDILGQLSKANPVLEEEIQEWLKTQKHLQRLHSGELFDPRTVKFIFYFDRAFLSNIINHNHGRWISQKKYQTRQWKAFRGACKDAVFVKAARHLIIDISEFEPDDVPPEWRSRSAMSDVMQILHNFIYRLPSLEYLDIFDREEAYDKYSSRCSSRHGRLLVFYHILCVFRNVPSHHVIHQHNQPCNCCPVIEISYGTQRGKGSQERIMKIEPEFDYWL